jgi:hypothetical protein
MFPIPDWLTKTLFSKLMSWGTSKIGGFFGYRRARKAMQEGGIANVPTYEEFVSSTLAEIAEGGFPPPLDKTSVCSWVNDHRTRSAFSLLFESRLSGQRPDDGTVMTQLRELYAEHTLENANSADGSINAVLDYLTEIQLNRMSNTERIHTVQLARITREIGKISTSALPGSTVTQTTALQTSIQFRSTKMAAIRAFRELYLISETGDVPFGGRQDEIALLDQWLTSDNLPNRFLLTGPTGRGKSALLVRWTEGIANNQTFGDWHLIFVPISMRLNTNKPAEFYSLLAIQLAEILNFPLQPPSVDLEGYYLNTVTTLFQQLANTSHRTLVVVDGIDEALYLGFSSTIFPIRLPASIKILLSARELTGDGGSKGWLRRLCWDAGVRVSTNELKTLDRQGVKDLFTSSGITDQFAPVEVIDLVLNLSDGEPLLLQLYVEDFLERIKAGLRIDIDSLQTMKPGFAPYFSRWLESQRQAWKDEDLAIDEAVIHSTLTVLACAFGPLQDEHLVSLVEQLTGKVISIPAETMLRPIRRFVIGRGSSKSGFVLGHPKLGQYLREEYCSGKDIRRAHSYFVEWGRSTLHNLEDADKDAISNVPHYLLQCHVYHLKEVGGTIDDYSQLLSNGWRLAWELFEGGYGGFSSNIRSIIENLGATTENPRDAERLISLRVAASLCLASIHSTGSNWPGGLLAIALEEREITIEQASHYIELQPLENRSQLYAEIFKFLPPCDAEDAIQLIYRTTDIGNRVRFLLQIIPHVHAAKSSEIITDASQLVKRVEHQIQRTELCIDLIPYLDDQDLNELTQGMLTTSAYPDHAVLFLRYLCKLFKHHRNSAEICVEIKRKALSVLGECQELHSRVYCLLELFDILPAEVIAAEAKKLLSIVVHQFSVVNEPSENESRSFDIRHKKEVLFSLRAIATLLSIPKSLPGQEYESILISVLLTASDIGNSEKCRTISRCLPLIREEFRSAVVEQGIAMARGLPSGNNRAHSAMEFLKYVHVEKRKDLVKEVLLNARLIDDEHLYAQALIALFTHLEDEERELEKMRVLNVVQQIPYALHRGEAFIKLSSAISGQTSQLLETGFNYVKMSFDKIFQMSVLINNLNKFDGDLKKQVFRYCLDHLLSGQHHFAGLSIALLAEKDTSLWTGQDLNDALTFGETRPAERPYLIPGLVPIAVRLGRLEVIDLALASAALHGNELSRIKTIAEVSQHLADDERKAAIATTLWQQAMAIEVADHRVSALIPVIGLFPAIKRHNYFQLAKSLALQVGDNWKQLEMLAEIAFSDVESQELFKLSIASASQSAPTTAIHALSILAPRLEQTIDQISSIDQLTKLQGISRPSLFMAIEYAAPAFANVGGPLLLCNMMNRIEKVKEWWQ